MEKFLWAKKNRVKNIQKTAKKAEADEKRLQLRPLGSGSQLDIFTECDKYFKEESCDKALYEIRKKYGKDAISFAALKRDIKLPKELNEIITLPNRHYNS